MKMGRPDASLFVKTRDLNLWLFQHPQRFLEHPRHTYTNCLESFGDDFEEDLSMKLVRTILASGEDVLADVAETFLAEQKTEQPFFLYLACQVP